MKATEQDSQPATPPSLDLSGEWRFALDPQDEGLTQGWPARVLDQKIRLPGLLTAQGYGEKPSMRTKWTGEVQPIWTTEARYKPYQTDDNFKIPFWLQPELYYVGAAWYQRDIELSPAWSGLRVVLELERPHWETRVWIDGREVGRCDRLGTPHCHDLGASLGAGRHTLTLRVDNRVQVEVGQNSHSISDHTQGNWNGVVGRLRLNATADTWIDATRIFPDADKASVRVEVDVKGGARALVHGIVRGATANVPDLSLVSVAEVSQGRAELLFRFSEQPALWSEFDPKLYTLELQLKTDAGLLQTRHERFGFRKLGRDGARLLLNGRRLFLRGTLECAIFPKEGHPPTDVESWRRIVRICKAHGLNHIRFHSWTPPEAAFEAADELGFYYQVEASSWANQGAEIGSGRTLDAWMNEEAEAVLKELGNHPSFMFFAYGNEPAGEHHKEWLSEFVARWKARDPRRFYTTGAGWPVLPGSDYHSAFEPRIQHWGEGLGSIINAQPPRTDFDWAEWVQTHPDAPTVSHEIGQWCVYPDYKEIAAYTGLQKARNFEVFRETAERNGVLRYAEDFLYSSGKLQALCYKADIEAALRTPGFGGFQLLDLHDFPGQGTALVGVLNPFWDGKGYISADEYRSFSGPVVPLARLGRLVFETGDTLEAEIELAHFGPADLAQPLVWKLKHGDTLVAYGKLGEGRRLLAGDVHKLGKVSQALPASSKAEAYDFVVECPEAGTCNSWRLWVFPKQLETESDASVLVTATLDAAVEKHLQAGGKVLWLPGPGQVKGDPESGPVQFGFSSMFWNTIWTQRQAPHTLGIFCDPGAKALSEFPTERYTNYQWWDIIHGSTPFILTQHRELEPLVHVIDDWVTGRKLGLLFEAKVGNGTVLACSADLSHDLDKRPAARQLRASLLHYLARLEEPAAKASLTLAQLRDLTT